MSSDVGHACCYAAKRMRSPRSEIGTPGDVLRDWDTHLLDVARIRAWERLLFVERGDGWIAEEAWRRALKGSACGLDTSPSQVGSRRRATCRTRQARVSDVGRHPSPVRESVVRSGALDVGAVALCRADGVAG